MTVNELTETMLELAQARLDDDARKVRELERKIYDAIFNNPAAMAEAILSRKLLA